MWFIGVKVEQETSAPPPKKNPRSARVNHPFHQIVNFTVILNIKIYTFRNSDKRNCCAINAYLGNMVISWLPKTEKYNM